MSKKIAVIGCGWLGFPLAKELLANGHEVTGTTTTEGKHRPFVNAGIRPVTLEIGLNGLACNEIAIWESDVLIIAIPPRVAAQGVEFHVGQIRLLLNSIPRNSRIIYVSSTSVYPALAGKYDESFPLDSDNTGNLTLYQSEQLILARQRSTIVRCGGLMGEQRVSGRYFAGREVRGRKQPVNYIHQADAIGLILGIVREELEGVYNLICPQHPTRSEVYEKNGKRFGFSIPTFKDDGIQRIIDGTMIADKLHYTFQYPDPRKFHS